MNKSASTPVTLTADLFVTLDGFALGEGAPAYFGYFGPELERWVLDELAKPQRLVLGRTTYELLWEPAQRSTDEPSRRMNELPKRVFSTTLEEPLARSNATLATSSLRDEIQGLKQQPGDPMRMIGSLSLVKSLLQLGLVDRLRLVVFPLVLGNTGREPLFARLPDIHLELLESTVLDARLLVLEYHPVSEPRGL